TYTHGNTGYVDICRHRKNFPPVERVAEFGAYLTVDEALHRRPGDHFLEPLQGTSVSCAVDLTGATPAWISLRIPVATDMSPAPASSGVRILAIDDQPVILELIDAMGKSEGFNVTTTTSAEEGLRLAREGTYDVILTDLAMPGISGLDLARQLKQAQVKTPVLLVTGYGERLSEEVMGRSGVHDILYKPFRIEQLLDKVEAALHSRR
ncbi:MAG: response regulator, partial [Candidatus Zixiibacteriota bacterium]